MFQALTRIMLALAMAFAFAGQMEAAAAHCAELAQADVQPAEPEQPDCHGMAQAAPSSHHPAPTDTPDAPAPDHCECIAALKVFSAPATLPASARIAPYAWLTAADAHFASIAPAPALRPPRA
jgi:hypothetical protein